MQLFKRHLTSSQLLQLRTVSPLLTNLSETPSDKVQHLGHWHSIRQLIHNVLGRPPHGLAQLDFLFELCPSIENSEVLESLNDALDTAVPSVRFHHSHDTSTPSLHFRRVQFFGRVKLTYVPSTLSRRSGITTCRNHWPSRRVVEPIHRITTKPSMLSSTSVADIYAGAA